MISEFSFEGWLGDGWRTAQKKALWWERICPIGGLSEAVEGCTGVRGEESCKKVLETWASLTGPQETFSLQTKNNWVLSSWWYDLIFILGNPFWYHVRDRMTPFLPRLKCDPVFCPKWFSPLFILEMLISRLKAKLGQTWKQFLFAHIRCKLPSPPRHRPILGTQ